MNIMTRIIKLPFMIIFGLLEMIFSSENEANANQYKKREQFIDDYNYRLKTGSKVKP